MTGEDNRAPRRTAALYLLSLAMVVWSIGPILWIALASVVPQGDFIRGDFTGVRRWSLSAYVDVLSDPTFRDALLNSAIVALGTTILCLMICGLAGYSLARLAPPGGGLLAAVLVASRMIPSLVLLIPLYLLMSRILGLADSYLGLVLVYTSLLCPFAVFILRSFFAEVPKSIEHAARVDGCNRLAVLRRVTLPLSRQGLVATAAFVFINSWNEFMIPLVLSGNSTKPATVKLAQLGSAPGGFFEFGPVMAASMITVVPPIVFFLFVRGSLVRGVTAGGVKS